MKRLLLIAVFFLVWTLLSCGPQPIEKEIVISDLAPAAIGPYSQAVRVGNILYLSGQLGLDPETGEFVPGGVEAQARQALENQKAVLQAAGFDFSDVVQCQVFLQDMNDYGRFNSVYAEYFEKEFTARAVVQVVRLPKDGLVEIMMVAIKTQ